jgi:cellulase
MAYTSGLLALLLSALAVGQQISTAVPETHLKLPTQKCTLKDGCKTFDTAVVHDALWRRLHKVDDPSTPCYLGSPLCSEAEACGKNCALEGVDYAARGVATKGDAITLNQFVKASDGSYTVSTPRVFLVAPDGKNYEPFRLLNQEFSFDVDVSKLVCGMNGALVIGEMSLTGGRSELNPAGAEYGTGYCDAQCAQHDFIDGVANINHTYGACCNEMDIWESNSLSQSLTPHACSITGMHKCTGEDECGQDVGVCDEWGCSYNPYLNGAHDYYGPGLKVDTTRKFTVKTVFVTDNGESTGTLTEIRRTYVQDGKVIENQATSVGGQNVSAITDGYCNATATWFQQRGGLPTMGEAIGRGMVLHMVIWNHPDTFMNWLDSGDAGPCNETEGDPAFIEKHHPDTSVTFSNLRWGEIGST